jgi:hypothetical protein
MDIYQLIAASNVGGSDLFATNTGDLETVTGSEETTQRILRRLLTNPGTYYWHPDYGAGLPLYIGQPLSEALYKQVKTTITTQLYQESTVARNPPPDIELQPIENGLFCQITYTDAVQQAPITLTFNLTP